ncbi:hypothetical protein HOLleu_08122 [Holothuria leucospilota]|uniref:Uncharacterized protein n=1 Tax=Holothuria leucospilota TaxID=206669 RepID=A0A9Q1CIE7_HOLLE|nr:hypothetical protein HOLleu_08122 [Holothuria leucospilota]
METEQSDFSLNNITSDGLLCQRRFDVTPTCKRKHSGHWTDVADPNSNSIRRQNAYRRESSLTGDSVGRVAKRDDRTTYCERVVLQF